MATRLTFLDASDNELEHHDGISQISLPTVLSQQRVHVVQDLRDHFVITPLIVFKCLPPTRGFIAVHKVEHFQELVDLFVEREEFVVDFVIHDRRRESREHVVLQQQLGIFDCEKLLVEKLDSLDELAAFRFVALRVCAEIFQQLDRGGERPANTGEHELAHELASVSLCNHAALSFYLKWSTVLGQFASARSLALSIIVTSSTDQTRPDQIILLASEHHDHGVSVAAAAAMPQKDGAGRLHLSAENGSAVPVEGQHPGGASTDDNGRTGLPLSYNSEEANTHLSPNAQAKDLELNAALFAAAGGGRLDAVRVLVERGADVNATDQYSRTALFIAAKQGHLEIVECLVNCGAIVGVKQKHGRTPLMFAVSNGHLDIVKYLLKRSPESISDRDPNQWGVLHIAAGNGRSHIVELLISKGVTINEKGPNDATPIYLAAQRGNADTVAVLIKSGASIDQKQSQGRTPLLVAVEKGFAEIVSLLVDTGASVNERDVSGNSPLYVAASKGYTEIVQVLVSHGASVNEKDNQERTPLMAAAKHGHLEIAKLLVEKGASIDDKQSFGRTALMLAISNRHREIVKLLLDCGASIDAKDHAGWSPLHIAAGSNQPDVVEMLIDSDASIDECTLDGTTPLGLGIQKGFVEVITILVERGARTVSHSVGQHRASRICQMIRAYHYSKHNDEPLCITARSRC